MGAILEYIKMAVNTIRSNKGRSFLTMLGIIIGISSVIMIISIGSGVAGSVTSDLNTIASGQVAIYSRENSNYAAVEFDQDDIDAVIEKVEHVKGASFTTGMYGKVRGPKGEFESYANVGNESQIFSAQEPIIKGRYYTRTDEENKAPVCVLREGAAYLLFGTSDVIGKTIDVTFYGVDMELEIIGIRQDNKSSIVNMMGYFEQVEFEMPVSVYADTFLGGEIYSSNMMIYGDAPEYSAQIAADAKELLETRHKVRGQGVILIESFADAMDQINQVMGIITAFIVLVAAISLFVGGIGVMNIMLVSVTERTREIGIRKALGARTGSILLQFLFESAIITFIGGVIGIIIGALGAALVCAILGFKAHISIGTVLIATVFSSAVGIFFGIYPAKRAAKLSPIEALRHE